MGPVTGDGCAAELSRFQRFCFGVLPSLPMVTAAIFASFRWTLVHSPQLAGQLATLRGGSSDKETITRPEVCARLLGSFREGLRPGLRGPVTDLAIFSRSWNIDLERIAAPARLWIGTADTAVPLAAARLLARQIPGCLYDELAGVGHFWLAENYAQALTWAAEPLRKTTIASP